MSMNRLPPAPFPIFTTVAGYREWRQAAFDEKKSVGFVATMGALHEGHISLVRKSLTENDLTVVSIFVNPAQFAPHEDLTTYPRTLDHDVGVLSTLSHSAYSGSARTPSALFLPSVHEMYPSGIVQDKTLQKGTFVEVKGYGHQMEGSKRPDFFRGVATVVTKLFNAIQPSRTYFGQKDIQQALLLRRMVRDLLLSHPTAENLLIVPTTRDPASSLALSSRNAYLTDEERKNAAPSLYAALAEVQTQWEAGSTKGDCIAAAYDKVNVVVNEVSCAEPPIDMKVDYIEMNDPDSFEVIPDSMTQEQWSGESSSMRTRDQERPVVASGALWVGRTRLIDNIVLGDVGRLGIV